MFACARDGAPLALVGGLLAICSIVPGPTMAGAGASTAFPPVAASVDATPAPCPWGGVAEVLDWSPDGSGPAAGVPWSAARCWG